jgi:hypothetical protein
VCISVSCVCTREDTTEKGFAGISTATLGALMLVRSRCERRDNLVRLSLRIRHEHSPQFIRTYQVKSASFASFKP